MAGAAVSGEPLPSSLATTEPTCPGKLVVFDGVCVLCSGGVRFVLAHERAPEFYFASAQCGLGQRVLAALGQPLDGNNSVVVIDSGRSYLKSDAVIQVAQSLKSPWSWVAALRLLPHGLRDWLYDCLARRRYRLFGRYDSCVLPEAAQRHRFAE